MNELAANQIKWSSTKTANYRYLFQIGCFCGEDTISPVIIEVRNGVRTSLTRANGAIRNPEDFYAYDTIEKVFQLAEKSINSKAEEVKVKYDPTLGYPISIRVDESEDVADDEAGYDITNFEVLQPN